MVENTVLIIKPQRFPINSIAIDNKPLIKQRQKLLSMLSTVIPKSIAYIENVLSSSQLNLPRIINATVVTIMAIEIGLILYFFIYRY